MKRTYDQYVLRGLGDWWCRANPSDPLVKLRARQPGDPAPYAHDGHDPDLVPLAGCHASRGDGECVWAKCPQERDGESGRTGRTCPLWKIDEDDE